MVANKLKSSEIHIGWVSFNSDTVTYIYKHKMENTQDDAIKFEQLKIKRKLFNITSAILKLKRYEIQGEFSTK